MSDDTPTQRLPKSGDASELVEERKKSRALFFILIGVGAALLIAIVVLLVILFGGGASGAGSSPTPTSSDSASPTPSDSPTATESATPTPTPTPTPTQDAAPPPSGPGFTTFAADTTVTCQAGNPPDFVVPPPPIEVRWETRQAAEVWFIMGTDDAVDSGYMQVPVNGDEDDFPYGPVDFPCNQTSQKFTMTILGTNGQHVNKTWTVTNNGDVF